MNERVLYKNKTTSVHILPTIFIQMEVGAFLSLV